MSEGKIISDICYVCDGAGLNRANYTNEQGKYVMKKEICYLCNGKGKIDYKECLDCGDIISVDCFNDHECDD